MEVLLPIEVKVARIAAVADQRRAEAVVLFQIEAIVAPPEVDHAADQVNDLDSIKLYINQI